MKYVTSHLTYEEVSQYEYLFVNILPDLEIDNFDNYNPNHSAKNWFNNLSIVGEIR